MVEAELDAVIADGRLAGGVEHPPDRHRYPLRRLFGVRPVTELKPEVPAAVRSADGRLNVRHIGVGSQQAGGA